MMRLVVIIALSLAAMQTMTLKAHGRSANSRYIDALISASNLNVTYSGDGAADASVTESPVPEVRQIINLKAAAILLLISHLDDRRLTAATYVEQSGERKRVPVGHICLDILTMIVKARSILVKDCADDGLGACVKAGYYFPPYGRSRIAMRKVKFKWQRAYRAGRIRFAYPAWLH